MGGTGNLSAKKGPTVEELHQLRQELASGEYGQGHLFDAKSNPAFGVWPFDGKSYSEKQLLFLNELYGLASTYPGGVKKYIETGRRLLSAQEAESTEEKKAEFVALDYPTHVVNIPTLFKRSKEVDEWESKGLELLKKTVFVLVAGGLGERLGYSGIKVELPVETALGTCYLQHYLTWVKRIAGHNAPFVIMTSNDTDEKTRKLIDTIKPQMSNLHILKQETVFCFCDNQAHLAIDENGKLSRKPHGHGDVHSLLYMATDEKNHNELLVDQWLKQGYEYIVFLQDTNAPAVFTIPISLALSEKHKMDMNFTCVPRLPKEAVGLLCQVLTPDGNDKPFNMNLEYNKFNEIAKLLLKEGGDCAAEGSVYSPFPGNINTLLMKFNSYVEMLKASHGAVPEFINPKYTDDTKRVMKKPTRIESLMQDFALLFKDSTKFIVGGTVFERETYQPVKNSIPSALESVKKGVDAHCAATGEESYYNFMRQRLSAVGVAVPPTDKKIEVLMANSLPVHLFPIITITDGAYSLKELSEMFPHPNNIHISPRSALIIEGNVRIESLKLDGALHIVGPPCKGNSESQKKSEPLIIKDLNVENKGWTVRQTQESDKNTFDLIRGFVLERHETKELKNDAKL